MTVTYLGKEFTLVKSNTKNGKSLDRRLDNCKVISLDSCYNKPSVTKKEIWEEWKELVSTDVNARRFGIVSYNCHFFTLGWITEFHGHVVSIYVSKFKQYMIYD